MANITINKIEPLTKPYYKVFGGVYEDFRQRAVSEYKFELVPLEYQDFISSLENGLLDCLILLEDNIPTSFLVSTLLISQALELNIIHCVGNENLNVRRKRLLERFLFINSEIIKEKVITYPMLGKQASFASEIYSMGFKCVNQSIMNFDLLNPSCLKQLSNQSSIQLEQGYSITSYYDNYYEDIIRIVYNSFKNSSDALFDPRFTNYEGVKDIINKIVSDIYGKFLPDSTKILLYNNIPCGICFINVTGDNVGNIPLIAVEPSHRQKKLGSKLLNLSVLDAVNRAINTEFKLSQINVSCDSDNPASVKMYLQAGFKESYVYPQAYRPIGA